MENSSGGEWRVRAAHRLDRGGLYDATREYVTSYGGLRSPLYTPDGRITGIGGASIASIWAPPPAAGSAPALLDTLKVKLRSCGNCGIASSANGLRIVGSAGKRSANPAPAPAAALARLALASSL